MQTLNPTDSDQAYTLLESIIAERVKRTPLNLFTTRAEPDIMWDLYLKGIPVEYRQHYNCGSCRYFIKRYGGLVTIDEQGKAESLLWGGTEEVPGFFLDSVRRLETYVLGSPVDGVFLNTEDLWGQAPGGGWSHLCGRPSIKYTGVAGRSPERQMFDAKQDFLMLERALREFKPEAVDQAVRVLQADALTRSEKALAVAVWFQALHGCLKGATHHARRNMIWLAVSNAPPGFAHVRSSILGTLLEDIENGLGFDLIKERWAKKLHPLQYQRPQAPPKTQAIERAEKLVEELGLAPSFARRFATLDDVLQKLWVPSPMKPDLPGEGIFGHLKAAQDTVQAIELPSKAMTWEKFSRDFLPNARTLEILVPSSGAFYGLTTAVHQEAPPILQWDGLDLHERNPASWFFYSGFMGSTAGQWGLRAGVWEQVDAVFLPPHRWQEPEKFKHHADLIFFAISKARDQRDAGLALFPEILRGELREVRSVIEAHSNSMKMEGRELPNQANGIAFQKNSPKDVKLRVRDNFGTALYTIDRWE